MKTNQRIHNTPADLYFLFSYLRSKTVEMFSPVITVLASFETKIKTCFSITWCLYPSYSIGKNALFFQIM